MNCDMKRLCEAVGNLALDEELEYRTDSTGTGEKFADVCGAEFPEAIVRAVLMALREPSRAMKDAASYVEVEGDYPQSFTLPQGPAAEAFTAMIDHILSEPDTTRGGENERRPIA